ncbi:hypothetical protein L9F63_027955, partial [Diploptera punctata]
PTPLDIILKPCTLMTSMNPGRISTEIQRRLKHQYTNSGNTGANERGLGYVVSEQITAFQAKLSSTSSLILP